MAIELDKDKLLTHLRAEMSRRWDARKDRPMELGQWFFGPGELEPECARDMRWLYHESYWDGVVDVISAILTFDDDIRGVEAIAALAGTMTHSPHED